MRERPILFSGPMVRAIVTGQKTVTRRAMKHQPCRQPVMVPNGGANFWTNPLYIQGAMMGSQNHGCPYGQPGDRLWVRETFYAFGRWITRFSERKGRDEWHFVDMTLECGHAYAYDADSPNLQLASDRGSMTPGWYKRPAIFMPRAASRLLPDITDVRVERLQDISEDQCIAEGIEGCVSGCQSPYDSDGAPACDCMNLSYEESFQGLWSSINGAKSWAANPWVWVVEFKRIQA